MNPRPQQFSQELNHCTNDKVGALQTPPFRYFSVCYIRYKPRKGFTITIRTKSQLETILEVQDSIKKESMRYIEAVVIVKKGTWS